MGTSAVRLGAVSLILAAGVFLGCSGSGSRTSPRSVAYIPPTSYTPAGVGATYAPGGSNIRYVASAGTRTASGAGYAATSRMPVDLPTVMRLVSGQNLDVSLVRRELREAHAELRYAKQWWLPNVSPTLRYENINGNVQGTLGGIFDVNKTNAFAGAGIYGDWEVGESIFMALAAKRRTSARQEAVTAGLNDATRDAGLAYFDLLRNQMALGIADQILALYEGLVKETEAAVRAGDGFRGDELRARARRSHATVRQRKADEARMVSAAKLREVLNLPRDVEVYAAEGQVARLEFISAEGAPDDLFRQAFAGRPELREVKMRRAAAHEDRRMTTVGPWIPSVRAGYEIGGFGNAFNSMGDTQNFGVGLQWTIGRDGIGGKARQSAAIQRERQWIVRQQKMAQTVVREVSEAQAEAQARSSAIDAAQGGLSDAKEALTLYAKRVQIGVGLPLDAIVAAEVLNDAQLDYLDAVVGFNKAQIKLLRAVGLRPDEVAPQAGAAPAANDAGPGNPPAPANPAPDGN